MPRRRTLDGKRALVTGGTRGISAAVAELLATQGAAVVVTARHDPGSALLPVVRADLASPDGPFFAAKEGVRVLGGIDVVVHCVGASFEKAGGILALTDRDWSQALDTNLLAAVRPDRAMLPALIGQGSGAVVHISSVQWRRPHPSSPSYGPARAALTSSSNVIHAARTADSERADGAPEPHVVESGGSGRAAAAGDSR